MTGHKLDNKEALKFIFAGKSLVTFVNTNTLYPINSKFYKRFYLVYYVSLLF